MLVVEDEQDTREVLASLLSSEGYAVTTTATAPAALEEALRGRFDLVISDIGMPGVSGYTLARELRKREEYRGVPLVAITGFAEFDDRHTAIWAGFDEHVRKPVEPVALLALIERLLAGR